ncbi:MULTISPECIES: VOC family protein [unclassified Sphingobacterium]|uniref:VOC family protein n=1 Tax=unclassified Sphingobacterium TaxID=2609468 RepID=UPI0025DD2AC8|nr:MULTISPECIES: VOC family protein [unclassified Sphingobacterium]
MKRVVFVGSILLAFGMGYAFNTVKHLNQSAELKRVTGIGGFFFKSKDPKKLRAWYAQHLGITTNSYGGVFEWYQGADSTKKAFTQWSPFKESTAYFDPSEKDFMINYRVEDIELLVEELKKEGVTVLDNIEAFDYGKFVHIMDIEGNKIELWQPNDMVYEKMGIDMGVTTIK